MKTELRAMAWSEAPASVSLCVVAPDRRSTLGLLGGAAIARSADSLSAASAPAHRSPISGHQVPEKVRWARIPPMPLMGARSE